MGSPCNGNNAQVLGAVGPAPVFTISGSRPLSSRRGGTRGPGPGGPDRSGGERTTDDPTEEEVSGYLKSL